MTKVIYWKFYPHLPVVHQSSNLGFHANDRKKTVGIAHQRENQFETTNFKFSLVLLNDFCFSIARIDWRIWAVPRLLETIFTQTRFAKQSQLKGADYNGEGKEGLLKQSDIYCCQITENMDLLCLPSLNDL